MDDSTHVSTPESTDTSSPESTDMATPIVKESVVKESPEKNQRNVSSLPKRKSHDADPRTIPLVASFSEKYLGRSGESYTPNWAKDGASLKRLFAAGKTPEAITAAMDLYLADEWYAEKGFDIGKFYSAFNSLVSRSKSNGRGKFQSVTTPEGKYAKYR